MDLDRQAQGSEEPTMGYLVAEEVVFLFLSVLSGVLVPVHTG